MHEDKRLRKVLYIEEGRSTNDSSQEHDDHRGLSDHIIIMYNFIIIV